MIKKIINFEKNNKNKDIPRCPECGADARRPKCLFELGGDCPRHDVMYKYRQKQRTFKED